ncbi:hypothetical protein P691DRAFT_810616 [Macrolepiota fuliginosa MF-IS2]|uniref:Tim44-like domain-containing protein n=1 Tax=Macrolepiota fuliginosa MF-IS2 TaxID=1400762 RepID=A0A9P5XG21_9AGAR|nr:hypothetical protein P691DRAFT_810616 [Macrolepiota fuliginosa MF-IS2]
MASGVSRTYLNTLAHAQIGFLSPACSSRAIVSAAYRRPYATAAVATNKNRPPVTAKKTASTEHLSSAPSPKVSVKTASRTHVAATGPAAKAGAKTAAVAATKPDPSKPKVMTENEQMEELDKILAFSKYMPTADVWGQKVETLDVMIPHPILSSGHQLDGLRGRWSQFWKNRLNDLKNTTSMVALASHNALPGINTANDRFLKKLFRWPFYTFGAKSTSPTSWLAPTRKIALDTYLQLNTAMAKNDSKEIKRLASNSFLTDVLAAQKKRSSAYTYFWRFHREVNPTQIVSLRVTEGYLAPDDPKFGNRLMVQALVKFDTEQSLEIYDRRGNALHTPAADAAETPSGVVPAEKQHVVQYLVLEKRMWYDGPWLIRDQVWEVNPRRAA